MRRRRGLYRATLRSIFRHSRTTCAWRPRWSRLRTREDAGREWPRRGCNRFVAGCNRESGQNRLQVATQSKSRLAGGCVTVSKLDNTKSRDFKSRPATGRVEATLERRPLVIIPCFRWTRTSKPNGIAISLWVGKSSQAEMIALSMLLKAATGFASWIGGNGPLIHPSRVLFATSGLLPGCPDG